MSKITYRDTFIKSLENEIDNTRNMCQFLCVADSVVEKAEKATHTRLTKASPKWFYSKLAVVIGDAAVASSKLPHNARHDIAKSIVEQAQAAAKGEKEEMASKAVLLGDDFNHLVDCVRAVSLNTHLSRAQFTYVELIVDKDAYGKGQMTAIATDGYRIIKHKCACCLQGNGFTTFIRVPKVKPGKYDMVSIVPDNAGVTVSFDNITLRYQVPSDTGKNIPTSKLYSNIQGNREDVVSLDVDVNYLRGLLNGLIAGKNKPSNKRVTLTVGKNQELIGALPYLTLKMDDSEAIVLPLRPTSKP